MASLKSQLVKSQHVTTAINLMLRSWAAKVTAAQGGKQLAADVLEDFVENYSAERWKGEIPTWEGGDTSKENVSKEQLFKGVMTMEKAFACVDDAANDCVARYATQRARQNRKVKRWRWWVGDKIATNVMARERLMTRTAIQAVALKKNPRMGRQKILTTGRSSIPESGRFVFGGRSAWRQPVGRPALPQIEWMARYNTRKMKRQKRNATAIKRRRGPVTVPLTKFPRPSGAPVLAK